MYHSKVYCNTFSIVPELRQRVLRVYLSMSAYLMDLDGYSNIVTGSLHDSDCARWSSAFYELHRYQVYSSER